MRCRRWAGRSRCSLPAHWCRIIHEGTVWFQDSPATAVPADHSRQKLSTPDIRVSSVRLRQGFGEMSEFEYRRCSSRHSRLPATADKSHQSSRIVTVHVFSTGYKRSSRSALAKADLVKITVSHEPPLPSALPEGRTADLPHVGGRCIRHELHRPPIMFRLACVPMARFQRRRRRTNENS